ncbi:MAG: cupin domain-containing protein [bacterium]|nr:cupin domain-containing protein [bacterium]
MNEIGYPSMITALPAAKIPFAGVCGWVAGNATHQVAFLELESVGEVPEHSHAEQWGVVIEGCMELTIDGETRSLGPGDSYHIPAQVPHSARIVTRVRAIDVFAEPDRFAVEDSP